MEFFSFGSYQEIYETQTGPTGMIGMHLFKRKRNIGLLLGLDCQFSEHQFVPLFKTGLQINMFNRGTKYHGGYYYLRISLIRCRFNRRFIMVSLDSDVSIVFFTL